MTSTAAPPSPPERTTVVATAVLTVVAASVLVVGLLVAGGGARPGTLADPGPLTTTGLPLARLAQDLLGVLAVGAALVAVLAAPLAVTVRRALGLLVPAAVGLAVATAAVYVLTASDLSGRTVPETLTWQVQRAFTSLPQSRALLLVLLAAVVLAVAAAVLRDREPEHAPPALAALLVLATAALVPPAFSGHSAAASAHELAVASLSLHLVAASLWVGGVVVLTVLVVADHRVQVRDAARVVGSFSTLALGCVAVVAASGVLNAGLRVTAPEQLWTTSYGLLLAVKALGLAALAGLGWWHRRRGVAAALAGAGRSAFARLLAVEVVVMVLVVAVAVALARTPPPG
ncbi:CopD family protein [Aquipuribacter sp. SD81]|uniref:CopD family protein n=1 Tax=Aquipuribacter sp. SD81 TaxID=3127703 RepID=UPI003018DE28